MIRKSLFVLLFLTGCIDLFAQDAFRQHYLSGKELFREGKYNLAMEVFKKAIPYDRNNDYAEYASFYYALAAYRQDYRSVAKDMLVQIQKLYPEWEKMDEVNFWLGRIYLDNGEYFQGLSLWSGIRNPSLKKDIDAHKRQVLAGITDPETLRMMTEEYPDDRIVGAALARALSANLADQEIREEFEAVIRKYRLNSSDYINEAPPSYRKDRYAVSVLYPFMLNTLEPTPGRKRNQLILDLYAGMKMAADTLNSRGVKIDLRAYDTERKAAVIQRILDTEELKNTDLIVGPFFQDENALVQEFSMKNRVNVFQAFTNNLEVVSGNEFGYLIQPSYETLARKSATFMANYVKRRKNFVVVYGSSKKDSIMAANFVKQANEEGLKVIASKKVSRENATDIVKYLATPTEFDEWRNPKEFVLKKDSIGGIYVASDDALIFSKVISSVETRRDSVVIVGTESWLDQTAIEYDKFQSLGVVLSAPNFYNPRTPHHKAFVKKYIKTHGQAPSEYAKLGYELMMFTGNALLQHGVYFQQAFTGDKTFPGYLSEGFKYPFSHDNQLVPFVTFREGALTVIRKL